MLLALMAGMRKRISREGREAIKAGRPAQSRRASRRIAGAGSILDLQSGLFERPDPAAIASSLKRVAQRRTAGKVDPYRSAMSMLTSYMNRERQKLSKHRWRTLELAKQQLRVQFHRPTH